MAVAAAISRARDCRHGTSRVARRRSRLLTVALVLAPLATLVGGTGAQGQETILGTAQRFAVLAGAAVTNEGTTVITRGDVGVSPGTAISGFPPGVVVGGTIRSNDAVAARARADAGTSYNALRSRSTECVDLTDQDLGDVSSEENPLPPGVYCFSSEARLTGTLYLEAGGEYVFLVGSDLVTATNSRVVIVGGPQDGCNIYWAVGTSATLGTDSDFLGTIIAEASITLDPRAEVNGRLIALVGAVTLIDNDVTVPTCARVTTTTSGDTTTTAPGGATTTAPGGATTTAPRGATTTLLPGGPGQGPGPTTTAAPATTTTGLQVTTTTGLAATTTTTAAPAATTTARSATTTTVRPGTAGTTGPRGGTGLGAGGTDSLRAAGSGDALALTGPAHFQPMLVAALLAVLLGVMMLMSSGPGVGGLLVAAGAQHGQRRGDADPGGGRDLQGDAGTSQGVTPSPLPPAQARFRAESDSRRQDISPAEATRSALRSAESISWTLRLPEA